MPSQPPTFQRARATVLTHGHNPTAYQILNPGIDLWFGAVGDAVVGYVDRPGVRVVAGNPVCPPKRLAEVSAEFEAATAETGRRVCYLGADEELDRVYRGSPRHARILVGAQPVVNPQHWPHTVREHGSLRAQLNRAQNKSVTIDEWFAEHATEHPELRRCLDEWLDARGLPPLHFLVEPDTLGNLLDRHVFVARRDGRVVAFLVASPVGRRGWHIEQMIRGTGAPNGTMELLMDAVMRRFATLRGTYLALGAAPLSDRATGGGRTPPLIRRLLGWQRVHARRYYNFEGLERFKAKFWPDTWEPVLAISGEKEFSVGTLYAIAGAYSGRSPVSMVIPALGRALVQEFRWLAKR
jgi:phosphatidylglycerol lysyltransferase